MGLAIGADHLELVVAHDAVAVQAFEHPAAILRVDVPPCERGPGTDVEELPEAGIGEAQDVVGRDGHAHRGGVEQVLQAGAFADQRVLGLLALGDVLEVAVPDDAPVLPRFFGAGHRLHPARLAVADHAHEELGLDLGLAAVQAPQLLLDRGPCRVDVLRRHVAPVAVRVGHQIRGRHADHLLDAIADEGIGATTVRLRAQLVHGQRERIGHGDELLLRAGARFLGLAALLHLQPQAPIESRDPDGHAERGGAQQHRRRHACLQPRRNAPLVGLVDERLGDRRVLEHAERTVGVGDRRPARRALVAELDQVRLDQRLRLAGFEQQRFATPCLRVLVQDQLDHLRLVRQRIVPPLQAGRPESAHALGVLRELAIRRHEVVAVEVDARGARRVSGIRRAELLEDEGLVGAVGHHRIRLAVEQIARIAVVLDARHAAIVDAGAKQHRVDILAAACVHEAMVLQAMHAAHVGGPARHQDDGGGMLEHGRQDDHLSSAGTIDQGARGAHAEVGPPFDNIADDVDVGTARDDGDVQPGVTVEALFGRRVIARELELVVPLQLQRDPVERLRRGREQQGQEQRDDETSRTTM